MVQLADALVSKRDSNGLPSKDGVSYADLGFDDLGLDDNWQACNGGFNGSFHDAEGNPLINKVRFPNMAEMVAHIHDLNLKAGFYLNNCICPEKSATLWNPVEKHYEGDVTATTAFGFDSVKLDGCSAFMDLKLWSDLFDKHAKGPMMIENCHWGLEVPSLTECPYHFFRTSGDISNNWDSMFGNLQTTIKFQGESPISRPGCWAYPDMLQVGRMPNFIEDRAHFGAWVITSSPLIMGHDLLNAEANKRVWKLFSNTEALRISRTWAGHPGRMTKSFGNAQIWMKPLNDGEIAVLFLNGEPKKTSMILHWDDVALKAKASSVINVWTGKDQTDLATDQGITFEIDSHDSVMFLIRPSKASTGIDTSSEDIFSHLSSVM